MTDRELRETMLDAYLETLIETGSSTRALVQMILVGRILRPFEPGELVKVSTG